MASSPEGFFLLFVSYRRFPYYNIDGPHPPFQVLRNLFVLLSAFTLSHITHLPLASPNFLQTLPIEPKDHPGFSPRANPQPRQTLRFKSPTSSNPSSTSTLLSCISGNRICSNTHSHSQPIHPTKWPSEIVSVGPSAHLIRPTTLHNPMPTPQAKLLSSQRYTNPPRD